MPRAASVVLVHAFPLNSQMWQPVAGSLRESGWDVHTPDLPGFGSRQSQLAGLPAGSAGEPSLDVFADALRVELDEAGIDRAVIGGLSLGGYVAMAFLRRYPEMVAGLILADTRCGVDDQNARINRLAFADRVERDGMGWVPEAMLGNLISPTTVQRRPAVADAVRRWISEADPAAVAWTQRAMAGRPDSAPALASFDGPSLLLVGSDDVMTPVAEAAVMADLLDASQLRIIADAGHLSAIEKPADVSIEISNWLTQRATTLRMR